MIILIGLTASVAQVVLLRELMVVFYGNEVSIGLMLASWLFWTAVGSSLAGRLAGAPAPNRLMAGIQVLLALVLPGTVLAVRFAKTALATVPGEIVGPGVMGLASLTLLSLFCLLSGALFTVGSRLYGLRTTAPVGVATGSVYLWEAAGSAAGGLLAGLALVRWWGALEIASLLSLLNLIAACGLTIRRRLPRLGAIAGVAGIFAGIAVMGGFNRLEVFSQQRFWSGFPLITTRSSMYGSLAMIGTEGSRSLYENGRVLFTVPDPAAAEETVHYALIEHPAPRSLLLIGGGLNGSIAQALRHSGLERIDYVELDPAILDLARRYFPVPWSALASDRRVHVHAMDGRLYVKTAAARFDVIIVNLPDPQTAQLNRFYTAEFFEEAAGKLTAGGVLSFRVSASENYISPELGEFLRSIHKTLRTVFCDVTAIPGESVHFFASNRAGALAGSADELLARLRARQVAADYVNEYFLPFRMSPDRMSDLESQIQPAPETPVNHDFSPIAYYFDVALWSSRFSAVYRSAFRAVAAVDFGALATALALLVSLAGCSQLLTRGERRMRVIAGCCTVATGFTLIGLEILLLLAFQSLYSYVYRQLAILIAAFMAGMALGSRRALQRGMNDGLRALGVLQVLVMCAPLALCGIFELAAKVESQAGMAVIGHALFPALALVCGMLGGYEFPLASRIFFASGAKPGAGALYAIDLAGSCAGALLFSIYLVPVFGFFRTALLISLVCLAPALMAILPEYQVDPGSGPAREAARRTPAR